MSEEYGKRVGTALNVIKQLHADTSRLLVDLERYMRGKKSLFGNQATTDMSKHVVPSTGFWMAEGVYRYFFDEKQPNRVTGMCVAFIDERITEPIALFALLNYSAAASESCRPWD